MLRKILIATTLLAASGGAMADHAYARVVTVEPHLSISFSGGSHHDGFRVMYESGGRYHLTHSHLRPVPVIWVPQPTGHYASHHHRHHHRHDWHEGRHRHHGRH